MQSVFSTMAHTNKKFIKHQLKLKRSGPSLESIVHDLRANASEPGTHIYFSRTFIRHGKFIYTMC